MGWKGGGGQAIIFIVKYQILRVKWQVPSCEVSREASAEGDGLRSEGKGFPGQSPDLKDGTDILHTGGGA